MLDSRVALILPISTAADTTLGACAGLAMLHVIVTVDLKHLVRYFQFSSGTDSTPTLLGRSLQSDPGRVGISSVRPGQDPFGIGGEPGAF